MDQYPWLEVGEHTIGAKLPRLLVNSFDVRDTGIPTGADQRFVISSKIYWKLPKDLLIQHGCL
jgi:hypothetical protein